MNESGETARLYFTYYPPDTGLAGEHERYVTIKSVFEAIKQKHGLEGGIWPSTSYGAYVELAQAQPIVRAALEDLINSEIGVPKIVHAVGPLWGPGRREEKLGIEIAQGVFGDAGHLLRPHRIFFVITDYYDVVEKCC